MAKLCVFCPFHDPNASSKAARKCVGVGWWTCLSSIAVRIKALAVFSPAGTTLADDAVAPR